VPQGPAARLGDPVAHPLPPVLTGVPALKVLIGMQPAWKGIPLAAAPGIMAANTSTEATLQALETTAKVAEAAALAAAGTPAAPGLVVTATAARLAAETAKLSSVAANSASIAAAAAGGASMHICALPWPLPPHGPGVVIDGSPTVMIENCPACRLGDTIIEAIGPPNKIMMGCPTVIIGDSGGGGANGAAPGVFDALVDYVRKALEGLGLVEVECRGKVLREQQEGMSCAQATTSMIIEDLSGKHVSEEQLRKESAARGAPPGYDPINGTSDSDVPTMLNDHGINNSGVKYNAGMGDVEAGLANGKPVQLGLVNPGHWVVVDGVRTNPDGSKTLLVRDPAFPGRGGCREIDATEFQNRFADPAAQAAGSCIVTFP
jgi:uncharacterized Zn-binding protein involved in type VI secretion